MYIETSKPILENEFHHKNMRKNGQVKNKIETILKEVVKNVTSVFNLHYKMLQLIVQTPRKLVLFWINKKVFNFKTSRYPWFDLSSITY